MSQIKIDLNQYTILETLSEQNLNQTTIQKTLLVEKKSQIPQNQNQNFENQKNQFTNPNQNQNSNIQNLFVIKQYISTDKKTIQNQEQNYLLEEKILQKIDKPRYFLPLAGSQFREFYNQNLQKTQYQFLQRTVKMETNLKNLIQEKKNQKIHFTENELISFTRQLIYSLEKMQRSGFAHKNLSLTNILVYFEPKISQKKQKENPLCFSSDEEDAQKNCELSHLQTPDHREIKYVLSDIFDAKVNNSQSVLGQHAYSPEEVKQKLSQQPFLAPEIRQMVQNSELFNQQYFKWSGWRSDLFSLGIILINMATLEDINTYEIQEDMPKFTQQIQFLFKKIDRIYYKNLTNMINEMVIFSPQQRQDLTQFSNNLNFKRFLKKWRKPEEIYILPKPKEIKKPKAKNKQWVDSNFRYSDQKEFKIQPEKALERKQLYFGYQNEKNKPGPQKKIKFNHVQYSNFFQIIIACTFTEIYIWKKENFELINQFSSHQIPEMIKGIEYFEPLHLLIVFTNMGVITIYQLKFKKQKFEFKNPSQILGEAQNLLQIIKILQFQAHETQIKQAVTLQNRDGQFLITGGQNRNISVWRLNDILPKHIYNEIQLEQNVSQINQNQNQNQNKNNNQNQNFQKFINNQNFFNNYDVSQIIEGIQPYKVYEKVHTKEITDLEQFNDGIYFASASLDQTVCVFDINKNDIQFVIRGQGAGINHILYFNFKNQNLLFILGNNKILKVWALDLKQNLYVLNFKMIFQDTLLSSKIINQYCVILTLANSFQIIDVQTKQKIISYDVNNLSDCLYLEDSQSLLAFNEDSMIQYIGYQE